MRRFPMERLRDAWRASPLPGFFAWWGGELVPLLPARWCAALAAGAGWHLLQQADGDWQLRRAGQAEPLARWSDGLDAVAQQAALAAAWRGTDPEDRRLALLLPPDTVLRRVLQLPLAARGKLHQVAGYEMDRQTPFHVAQVHYAVRELAQPAVAGRCAVELLVVRRDTLDPLLARLGALGIAVDAVDLPQDAGRLGIDLLPPEQAARRTRPRLRLNLALAAAVVVLSLLAMGSWLHNREDALAQMQAQVDAMRGDAQQVAALRKQLQDDAGAAGFLAQRKAQRPTVLGVLLDLTNRLPASAWMERFSLDDGGQVGFQGQSPQAAKLLDALKGSNLLDNANFQGSIQPDPASGKERFYMVAQLHKPAPARTAAGTGDASRPADGGSAP
ncbi:PilN domain-containing protein [Rhodanobacter sp. DHB23]|uniref:PilN domain-containing protein n=1 Tax=Rhodanobacter sp. DHB23 TaxID=2775923 RepID=UPI0017854F82|nr:PilN domain-containing protein [Rhodanobacter sp. DHB23]MBD8872722.1 fimbrial assembly protein [Rhodanobacter sp. DHB23]